MQMLQHGRMLEVSSLAETGTAYDLARAMADLVSCLSYEHVHTRPLAAPVLSFEGLLDDTAEPGVMSLWSNFTSASFVNIPVAGGTDFILTHRQEVGPSIQVSPGHMPGKQILFEIQSVQLNSTETLKQRNPFKTLITFSKGSGLAPFSPCMFT